MVLLGHGKLYVMIAYYTTAYSTTLTVLRKKLQLNAFPVCTMLIGTIVSAMLLQ
jgi:hypothetical protein